MSDVKKISPWSAALAAGVVLALAGTVAVAAPSAVPTTPSQQEALDGLETARIYIQQHPDTPLPTETTTPPVATTTKPPATTTEAPTPTPTTPPPTTSPASTRPSGLKWSSGVWANQDRSATQSFLTTVRGGRAADNYLVYTWRNSMAAQNNAQAYRDGLPANFNPATQDLVLGLTTWTSDGAFMTASQAQGIGTSICSVDSNAIVRLDWEMNLPDGAGDNGAALTAANYTAWVARFRAVSIGLKATCPGIRIDFNPNHGGDQTSGCNTTPSCSRKAFQAVKDLVTFYGIDSYDSWPPVTASGSGWNAHLTQFNGLDESRAYALANGKKWSVPEWGLWTGSNGGNDDPEYIRRYIAYFAAHASDMGYETYFNEPDPYINSDLISSNPNSRAAYRSSLLAQ